MELISIIVCVFNGEKTIERCLTSLLSQTYENIEVVIVDDGSTDNTALICKKYKSLDDRIKYYYEENGGVSIARNKGITLSKGQYIGFCDADDWVEPEMYKSLYDLICYTGADAAINSFIWEYKDGSTRKQDQSKDDESIRIWSPIEAISQMIDGKLLGGYLWQKLFRRNVLENQYCPSEIKVLEDRILTTLAFSLCNIIAYKSDAFYHYCQNEESILHSFNEQHYTIPQAIVYETEIIENRVPELIDKTYQDAITRLMLHMSTCAWYNQLNKKLFYEIRHSIKTFDKKAVPILPNRVKRQLIIVNCGFFVYSILINLRFLLKRRFSI